MKNNLLMTFFCNKGACPLVEEGKPLYVIYFFTLSIINIIYNKKLCG